MEYGNAISFFKLEIIIIIIIIISVIRLDSFCYVFQSLVDPVQLVQSRWKYANGCSVINPLPFLIQFLKGVACKYFMHRFML